MLYMWKVQHTTKKESNVRDFSSLAVLLYVVLLFFFLSLSLMFEKHQNISEVVGRNDEHFGPKTKDSWSKPSYVPDDDDVVVVVSNISFIRIIRGRERRIKPFCIFNVFYSDSPSLVFLSLSLAFFLLLLPCTETFLISFKRFYSNVSWSCSFILNMELINGIN